MGSVFVKKRWKMGNAFGKKVKKWGGCKKVDLSSTQGALCTVSVFLFYILLIGGGVRTHPTHPPPAYGPALLQVGCCGPGGQEISIDAACGERMRAVPRCQRT